MTYILDLVQGGGDRSVTVGTGRSDEERTCRVTVALPPLPPSAKRRAEGDVAGVFPSAKRTHIAPALLSWSRGACLGGRAHLLAGVQGGEGVGLGTSPLASRGMRCVLGHRWAVDTGKCVDSSPLVVCQEGTPPMVYCGSHSGVFVGVALHSGEVRWRRKLSDRVESSACLCGEFVCVGESAMWSVCICVHGHHRVLWWCTCDTLGCFDGYV